MELLRVFHMWYDSLHERFETVDKQSLISDFRCHKKLEANPEVDS